MIRRATPADHDGLKAAIVAAYAPFAAQGLALPAVSEGLDGDIRDHQVWVADDRGVILGGVVLVLRDGRATLANLAVHPTWGGQGLGHALVDTVVSAAQEAGCSAIDLTTHREMTATQDFYARMGWTKSGTDGDKIAYTLDLTKG
mgnify:CR=1 FL=1